MLNRILNYNGMTAYLCRRFIPTTDFLVCCCGCGQEL